MPNHHAGRRALPCCGVECRIEKWSNSLFRKRGIFEAALPVGDSIIDLGGVKTQEAAAAKGRRRRRRTEEETPLNFLVLFFKSDKWLAKMSVLPFCHAIFAAAAAHSTLATRKVLYCEEVIYYYRVVENSIGANRTSQQQSVKIYQHIKL